VHQGACSGWICESDYAESPASDGCHDDGFAHDSSDRVGCGFLICCREPAWSPYGSEPGVRESSHLKVRAKFGASGLLKDEIADGAKAEVFASANMEHPQALAETNKSGPVVLFARNKLCALARPGLAATSDTLLERMLDPQVKLGTSTPKADPSGDYALEAFRKAEAIRPNAQSVLQKKALQLTGSTASAAPPSGRNTYGWHVAEGRADIFLAYCTAARDAQKENPGLQVIALPDVLAVSADYGLTVMADASPGAYQFALFILSSEGQGILASYGFSAPNLPN
jgi:ABC-type molybdate transport system substrate-binding protein